MAKHHCSKCGTVTENRDGHQYCDCGNVDYNNPAPAAGIAILRGNQVLLSKRARAPLQGQWDLVGGFIEAGESANEAAARECLEETGLRVENLVLRETAPGTYAGKPTLNLLFTGSAKGDPVAADDSLELRWFSLQELPQSLAWPHEAAFLRKLIL